MTTSSLLALFILVPLVSAGVTVMLPWGWARRALALAVPAAGVAGGIWLLVQVGAFTPGESTVLAENIGAFGSGVAIPIAADTLTALMLTTTAIVALVANWFAETVGETRARFYPALTLMLIGGAWGALLTADLFNLFVFIEVMLMPSFGLMAMTGTWARLASGRTFVIVNLVTSLTLLSGVAFVYGVVGTTNLAALAGAAGPRGTVFDEGVFGSQWELVVALGIVLIALSIKGGVAPVHTWLPRSYPATSPAVMAIFSGLHTKVALYAILRVFMVIFEGDQAWTYGILAFVLLGMLIGAYAGLAESTMRGVLGYQMVQGIPFTLVALAFLGNDSQLMLSAAIFYMLHSMIVTASLVMATGAIEETYGFGKIRPLSGIMARDPFVSAVFALGALAIIGFPPFSGMWGKLFLVIGVAQDGSWASWVTIAAIILASIGALFSMLYLWREVFWGRQMNSNECPENLNVPTRYVLPSASLIVVSLAMFVGAGPLFTLTNNAADDLTDTTAYVTAILGDEDGNTSSAIGTVLPPGRSGLDNVPDGQLSSAAESVKTENEIRESTRNPAQHEGKLRNPATADENAGTTAGSRG